MKPLNFDDDFIYDFSGHGFIRIEQEQDADRGLILRWVKDDETFVITDAYGNKMGEGYRSWWGLVQDFRTK